MRIFLLWILVLGLAVGCSDSTGKRARKPGYSALDGDTSGKPRLTAVTPSTAAIGATVTLTGTDLGTAGSVIFGSATADKISSWSATSIKVVVPAGAAGNVYVKTGGLISNKLPFAVLTVGGGGNPPPPPPPPGGCGSGPCWPVMLTGLLQGKITDAYGAPATGARVVIADNPSFSVNVRTVVADAAGNYSLTLPAGTFYVKAGKDGNANNAYFDAAFDQIGWGGTAVIIENLATVMSVTLALPVNGSITGGLTVDTSWGSTPVGVVSLDQNSGSARYAAIMTGTSYFLPESVGVAVGVVSYVDTNGNGVFDANVEPAMTLNPNVAANAAGVSGTVPRKGTLSGTVSNAAGWTLVAVDQNNTDPAGNPFVVGSQKLGAAGSFTITGFANSYDLIVFQDVNGNGVPDNGELQYVIGAYNAGDAVTGITFPVPGPTQGLLTGTVRDSAQTRTVAQVVVARDPNFTSVAAVVMTDTRGEYTTALAPGDYYVKAGKDMNVSSTYFQVGIDEIGYNAVFTVDLGLTTGGADVFLASVVVGQISGVVTTSATVTSWGSAKAGVVSWDLLAGLIRNTALPALDGSYVMQESWNMPVGMVTFRDLNGNGRFDIDTEPARTMSFGTAATAAGINYTWTLDKRTITGTVPNGAGWTFYAQDRGGNRDPSNNRWVASRQSLTGGGAFTVAGLATIYRLRAFHDDNGNGIPDGNEVDVRLVDAAGAQTDVDVTAGDVTSAVYYVPARVVVLSTSVTAGADGYFSPGETGSLVVALQNERGPVSNVSYTITAQNATVFGATSGTLSLGFGQTAQLDIGVTAAMANPGEQIRIRIAWSGVTPPMATTDVWLTIYSGAPYSVASIAYHYADLATNGSALELFGAEQDQNSDWIDFQAGAPLFPGSAFAFLFYGVWMTDATANPFGNGLNMGIDVGDNGYIDFLNQGANNLPELLPSVSGNTQFILAALWTDVMPGQVFALATGTAPNRILTIQWVDAARWNTPTLKMDFAVQLYETSGIIDVMYQRVTVVGGDQHAAHYGDGKTMTGLPMPTNLTAYRLTPNW